jgi:hypothetical protein
MSAHLKTGLAFACLVVTGCERAPSFDVLGSYVPGWLVALTVALALTVLVRVLVLRLKIELAAPAVAYPSLLAGLTCALWLLFLR